MTFTVAQMKKEVIFMLLSFSSKTVFAFDVFLGLLINLSNFNGPFIKLVIDIFDRYSVKRNDFELDLA
jgi:hypothetical protein